MGAHPLTFRKHSVGRLSVAIGSGTRDRGWHDDSVAQRRPLDFGFSLVGPRLVKIPKG